MSMNNQEQLAVFGKNRYHDWAILFLITIIGVVAGIAYGVWSYISINTLVEGKSVVVSVPSQFEDFKDNVQFLSERLEARGEKGTSTIPQDPSLR